MAAGDDDRIAERFGANLKRARRVAGLSQEEAGIRASLHRTEIGMLERGERTPRIDTAIKLAGAVKAPLADLLAEIEWIPGAAQAGDFRIEPRAATPAREARRELEKRDERIDAQLRRKKR